MAAQQTVFGFFDTMAEAQQAIQRLLDRGFTHETITLSTPTGPAPTTDRGAAGPDSRSGRFFFSLFGDKTDSRLPMARANADANRRPGTLVTVKTQSADEASQVAGLLNAAGAADTVVEADG